MLDERHLAGIGRVARACAHLELMQGFLTAALTTPDPSVRQVLAPTSQPFEQSQKLARKLTTARFAAGPEKPEHALYQPISAWMADAKKLVEVRNEYLHGLWGQSSTGGIGYLSARSPYEAKDVSVEMLHRISADMDQMCADLTPLLHEVESAVLERSRDVLTIVDQAATSK